MQKKIEIKENMKFNVLKQKKHKEEKKTNK